MGCSSSVISPEEEVVANSHKVPANNVPNHNHDKANGDTKSRPPPYGGRKESDDKLHKQKSHIDKNANQLNAMDQTPVPKSIAFDVSFTEGNSLMPKQKPARLLTLEPLNVTTMTAKQLEEKQKLADEKRERIRQKKINKSQKTSRRRKDLLKARDFGLQEQMEQEKATLDLIKKADIKREQRLLEIKEKQRIREERAKRAREKAKKMQNPDDEVEVEKDEQFNVASDESWLDNPAHDGKDDEEGIHKRLSQQSNLRPTASASTVDSYDNAFMRTNTHEKVLLHDAVLNNDEDFFGS